MKHILLTDYDNNDSYQSLLTSVLHSEKDSLEDYLDTIWNQRICTTCRQEEDQPIKTRQQILTISRKNVITTKNYIGTIQYGNFRIEIKPRILRGTNHNWGLNVLFWLSYKYRINVPFHKLDLQCQNSDNILEILIMFFARYANEVLSAQPYFTFAEEECQSHYLRGQLMFNQYINHNLTTGQWHKFHIKHKPHIYDNTFNRIIKYVAASLLHITRTANEELSALLFLLDEVSDVACCTADCDKVSINPLYEEYYSILDMCRMFLDDLIIDYNTGTNSNFCFLMPMNLIFEDFIYGFIHRHFPETEAQYQKGEFLAHRNGYDVFKTYIDTFLTHPRTIIDTKYKIREYDDGKAGVSEKDMYQMISYTVSNGCDRAILLYPYASGKYNETDVFNIHNRLMQNVPITIQASSVDICVDFNASLDDEVERIKGELEKLLLHKQYFDTQSS